MKLFNELIWVSMNILAVIAVYGAWFKNWGAKHYEISKKSFGLALINKPFHTLVYKIITTFTLIMILILDCSFLKRI